MSIVCNLSCTLEHFVGTREFFVQRSCTVAHLCQRQTPDFHRGFVVVLHAPAWSDAGLAPLTVSTSTPSAMTSQDALFAAAFTRLPKKLEHDDAPRSITVSHQ